MMIWVCTEEGLEHGKQSGVLQTGLSACTDDGLEMLVKEKTCFKIAQHQESGAWGSLGAMEVIEHLEEMGRRDVEKRWKEGTTVTENEDEEVVLLIILQTKKVTIFL